ncbi:MULTISPECIES: hypothetical protein [Cyanophyceae]|uniref:hypothetical protein n=1 Tax=Cyanophyceae TaxID=3028117 RepID=UPI00168993B2|nr:hypothetical protein [Trichocoleus sp. FACHB-40]MBD2006321.1 hypothetical protein [Trichocoleus sp. FACHB-40]
MQQNYIPFRPYRRRVLQPLDRVRVERLGSRYHNQEFLVASVAFEGVYLSEHQGQRTKSNFGECGHVYKRLPEVFQLSDLVRIN